MKNRLFWVLLALVTLIANVVVAADGDERFHGGSYDGYAQNSVLNAPITLPNGTIITICRFAAALVLT